MLARGRACDYDELAAWGLALSPKRLKRTSVMKTPQHHLLHRISQRKIAPPPVTAQTGVAQLLDEAFLSYNAGRLREACQLYAGKMLAADSVVGLTVSGALTPAGLGMSCLVPLI